MSYLIKDDYKKYIQTDNLTQIIGSDTGLLTQVEAVAKAETVSYLVQKYDTDKEFTDTTAYVYGATYGAKDRVYLDASAYSSASTYTAHSLTLYGGNVYYNANAINTPESWTLGHWTLLGSQYDFFYVSLPHDEFDYYTDYVVGDIVWYNDKNYTAVTSSTGLIPSDNSTEWGAGVSYSTSVLTTDGSKWTNADNRNALFVTIMIDVVLYHLHSRIAPRNIPELRVKRYDDSISLLKNFARGNDVTANIPKVQPTQGMRLRMGSRLEKQNNNF